MITEYEIINLMNNIEYGWLDKNNKKHKTADELYFDNYRLQSPLEIIKNGIGLCWDQVELERYYFNKTKLDFQTYFLCHYDNDKCPTHTFLVFEKDKIFHWFEHSWEKYKGIHKYDNLKELLVDIREKFIETKLNNNYNNKNLILYEYNQPIYGIDVKGFFRHCESGNYINIDTL